MAYDRTVGRHVSDRPCGRRHAPAVAPHACIPAASVAGGHSRRRLPDARAGHVGDGAFPSRRHPYHRRHGRHAHRFQGCKLSRHTDAGQLRVDPVSSRRHPHHFDEPPLPSQRYDLLPVWLRPRRRRLVNHRQLRLLGRRSDLHGLCPPARGYGLDSDSPRRRTPGRRGSRALRGRAVVCRTKGSSVRCGRQSGRRVHIPQRTRGAALDCCARLHREGHRRRFLRRADGRTVRHGMALQL